MILSKRGTFTSGAHVLIAIILIIATLLVFVIALKNWGAGGTKINTDIASKLTDLLTR